MEMEINYSNPYIMRFITHLKENEDQLLDRWLQSAMISKNDPFFQEIIENGRNTIHLIYSYVETKDVQPIIALTKKTAGERIEANVNIGEFVHNINIGRALVNEVVLTASTLNNSERLLTVMTINKMFDIYVYYAIKEYTDLKDSIILHKNQFIQEMHNDRLSILGQIAASFAHEFRNPLTSIKGFVKLLEEKYRKDAESNLFFDVINHEMESLQDKVSRFLFLSKSKGLDDEMEVVDLSIITKQMIDFMYPRFVDENIDVHSNIQENCLIFAVTEQIKQILLNILNNAVEELSEHSMQRQIEIELKTVEQTIELIISNNGKMIPAHLIENIFQPFVTTKNLGTGLGLSVVKQIVEKHEGMIKVDTNEDKTTFTIIWKAK